MEHHQSSSIIENYINAILRFQQEKQINVWNLQELENLSKQLGLNEQDLLQIDEYFKACLDRGQGFLYYNNFEKALPEFETASTLKPLHAEALLGTAECYQKRWEKKADKKDLQKAFHFAERCLQSEPRNQKAIKLISELQQKSDKKSKKKNIFWASVILCVGIITIGLFLWWFLNENKEITTENTPQIEKNKIIIQNNENEIPLKLIISHHKKEIENSQNPFLLTTKKVFWKKNENKIDCYVKIILETNHLEIKDLEARIQFFDENNHQIIEEEWNLEPQLIYELRPKDELVLYKTIQNLDENIKIKEAVLMIENIKTSKPEKYDDLKNINFQYETPVNSGYNPKISERQQLIEIEADGFFHTLQLQVENKGNKELNVLWAKIIWYDTDKKPIAENSIELITTEQPAQKPNTIRTFQKRFWIPHKRNEYQNYKIFITNIR
jgi:tetratricopeptide (TPR) repeat protein